MAHIMGEGGWGEDHRDLGKGMDYPEGNPVTVILQPGEQVGRAHV